MELTTLRTEVRSRLGETTEDFWKDADIDRALNEAQRRFASEEKWLWLYTVATASILRGDDTLALQTGIAYTDQFDMMLTSTALAYPLVPIRISPGEGVKARRRYFNITGFPRWYYLESQATTDESGETVYTSTIRLVPAASDNYDVEFQYVRNPADMVNDNDIPDVPEEFQGALVAWATAQLWMKELTGGPKAQEQLSLYAKVLHDAIAGQREQSPDDVIAWGKQEPEFPGSQVLSDWVYGRIPASVGI